MLYAAGHQRNHPSFARKKRSLTLSVLLCISLLMIAFGAGAAAIFAGQRAGIGGGGGARSLAQAAKSAGGQRRSADASREPVNTQKTVAPAAPANNSFRISNTSDAGADRDAAMPEVAYNPDDNEYLVVWEGDGRFSEDFRQVKEIYGQRINAATGAEVGGDFRISNMSNTERDRGAAQPQVVYNSNSHEYMVVWNGTGRNDTPDEIFEIYGQRVSRTGTEVGTDFRISKTTELGRVMGSIVRASTSTDVAWNSAANQYLVVWGGIGQPEDFPKSEIYGQLVNATGGMQGKNFRISNTTDQGPELNANGARVAYNSTNNQYLVVWSGGFKDKSQSEIWGQGLTAEGAPVGQGNGDFRISQINAQGGKRSTGAPHIAYNNSTNEYLVVFQANALASAGNDGANEIFGERINAATLALIGPKDFRISNSEGPQSSADNPHVAYNAVDKEYLVTWRAIRAKAPYEVFGQRLSPAGVELETDFPISNIAAVGEDRNVNLAAVACNSAGGECLSVWQGNALPGPANKKIDEIFGLRLRPSSKRRP